MKTTLEIPNATFRRAKSHAAAKGVTFREFVTEALEEKLRKVSQAPSGREPKWMRLAGTFGNNQSDRRETVRIQEEIDREFEVLEREEEA